MYRKKHLSATVTNLKTTEIQSNKESSDQNEEPANYFGSNAASWKAKQSRSGGVNIDEEDDVPCQTYVISGCLCVFLVYFCILREENDVDEKLTQSLYDQVEGLEVTQLKIVYNYNKEKKLPVNDIENRLNELGVEVIKDA